MSAQFPLLFQPFRLGRIQLRNRIVMPPMGTNYGTEDGFVSETLKHYYTARATQVYRQAIDDAVEGRAFRPALLDDLEGLASRGYTDGFYQRHETAELQNYRQGISTNTQQIFVGEVMEVDRARGLALVDVKNRFAVGDELELLTPNGNHRFPPGRQPFGQWIDLKSNRRLGDEHPRSERPHDMDEQ